MTRIHPPRLALVDPRWLRRAACALLVALSTWPLAATAATPVPAVLPLQGALTSPGGAPVADGLYGVQAKLYDGPDAAANAIYTESLPAVQVQGGVFAALLGTGANGVSLNAAVFETYGALWLGLSVQGEPELPRVQLAPTPFAMRAVVADKAATADLAAVANAAKSLQCTGCVTLDNVSEAVLSAEQHKALYKGQQTNVQTALADLHTRVGGIEVGVSAAGGQVTVGTAAAVGQPDQCVATIAGVCVGGHEATLVVTVPDAPAMEALPGNGVIAYRPDDGRYFGKSPLGWRPLRYDAFCGDGKIEGDEACDDGANNALLPDACRPDCTLPVCGDGVQDSGEGCDDGNGSDADGCVQGCVAAACGDGYVQQGVEACDDGNADNTDGCVQGCVVATCGDGFVQQGVEACDDGNSNNDDVCANDCTANIVVDSTFTSCGQTGPSGPSQNQCNSAYAGDDVLGSGNVTVNGGYQYWTVPATATYRVEAWGAKGGQHSAGAGGNGAYVRGDFQLSQGTVLKILVGQMGKSGSSYDVGGGGGTFVADENDNALIVAAGGGAAGNCGGGWNLSQHHGKAAQGNGGGGSSSNDGGYCGCGGAGSGGAGFTGNGGGGGAGLSFINGGTGAQGERPGQCVDAGWGGFGGGGNGGNGGGGGGGYEGGAGGGSNGAYGRGGKSFNSGSNPTGTDGQNSGHGKVHIKQL